MHGQPHRKRGVWSIKTAPRSAHGMKRTKATPPMRSSPLVPRLDRTVAPALPGRRSGITPMSKKRTTAMTMTKIIKRTSGALFVLAFPPPSPPLPLCRYNPDREHPHHHRQQQQHHHHHGHPRSHYCQSIRKPGKRRTRYTRSGRRGPSSSTAKNSTSPASLFPSLSRGPCRSGARPLFGFSRVGVIISRAGRTRCFEVAVVVMMMMMLMEDGDDDDDDNDNDILNQ